MTVKYKTVITKAGAIKLAAATIPGGKKVNFTAMAVGDGGGTLPTPDPNQTKLVKEVWRHALNKISQDRKNKNYVVAELLIPPETGGFWMRELGLYDDAGTLIAVGNMAESYKPALAEGSGRAQTVRMVIMVSDIESVELTIDTSTVVATQDYVDDKLAEHEQSRRHPDATLTAKGFTQLSSATDSTSETVAATPKAVKAAYDLAKGKYTAQDATTAQKGIVQLSSATDSASETAAATPKAVKAAYDLAKGKYTAQDATTEQKGIVRLSSATDSVSELLAATPKAVKTAYDLADTANKAAKLADDNADTRLLKTSNLSDIPDKAKARSALELKTAATRDVTTSTYDTTAGRVLKNGDYGQGTDNGLALLNSIFDITCTAKYSALGVGAGANATQGMPANSGNTRFSVEADNIYTGQYWVTLRSTSQIYLGLVNTTNKTASWTQYYTELYKPTATDVDAVSASQGGVFQGQVQFRRGLRLQNSEYLAGIDYGTDAASFSGANLLLKSWYGIGFYSNYPNTGELGVMGYVNVRIGRLEMKEQIIPGNYANFDNRYYTQAVADGRFQPKGNYTPAGQAYTKAESDGRFNLKNTASKNSNGWHKDSSTGIIIQFGSGGYTNGGRITFPIAFPNACLSVTGNDTGSGIVKVSLGARNTTGFTMYSEQSNVSLNWIAIGY
ncbi:phage tail-collar fiber domain-containing protein [Enterobacter cloacae]|uniref:phage tail-collar fiber domain-containing protein n=2 Tax=Enterobacter cloacae TaxID=550 RepID=UPI002792B4CD|nr:phage tail protein [Enterobacter cloacae]MDQ1756723.1 phage tail protein [Enterobacter cloacae]